MPSEKPPFLVLSPALQTYAWGKKGSQSEACSLKASADPDFVTDENQTYAEVGKIMPGPVSMKCLFVSRSYSCGWERIKRVLL